MVRETDFAAPKEIVDITINGSRLKPLVITPDEISAYEKPISPSWRADIVGDYIYQRETYTKSLDPTVQIKTPHEARKEFFEKIGL